MTEIPVEKRSGLPRWVYLLGALAIRGVPRSRWFLLGLVVAAVAAVLSAPSARNQLRRAVRPASARPRASAASPTTSKRAANAAASASSWTHMPITSTLSPAEVISIVVDEDSHAMDIAVAEDKLSQAIGRGGARMSAGARDCRHV